ncbi:MAG: cysteine hydrolase [Firmicutes bacterium]|nr:cysteine hydrolase [Bacillota bacterium]
MKKILVIIDMQNDFVDGSLGTDEARKIVPYVAKKIEEYKKNGHEIIFTKDTHDNNYLTTQEGKNLPVCHCIKGTKGHDIVSDLDFNNCKIIEKPSFGSFELSEKIAAIKDLSEIELCGLCTDICIVSNALILKAKLPEIIITVDSKACAGVTVDTHNAALTTMKMCQINILN